MLRRAGTEILVAGLNSVLFFIAFGAGLRVVYPVVSSLFQLGRVEPGFRAAVTTHQALVMSSLLAFTVFAVPSRLWTRHALNVALVSGLVFLGSIILLGQAMYLADRGDPNIMWGYIRPRLPDYFGALCSSAASVLGWHLGARIWRMPAVPSR